MKKKMNEVKEMEMEKSAVGPVLASEKIYSFAWLYANELMLF